MSETDIDQIIADCGGPPRRHSYAPDPRDARIEALEAICRAYLERGEYQTMCSEIRAALNDTESEI